MKIEIDPLKVPAFQRRKNITYKKSSFLKTEKDTDSQMINRLRQENVSAMMKKGIMDPNANLSFETSRHTERVVHEIREVRPASYGYSWRKMERVGSVDQYFAKIQVVAICLDKNLKVGDRIIIESPSGLFEQNLESMQINRQDVQTAKRGDDVGMKVKFEPNVGGGVYKVVAEG